MKLTIDAVFNLKDQKQQKKIIVQRPTEETLFRFMDNQTEIKNYSKDHVLNTPAALKRNQDNNWVCTYCFSYQKIYAGYEDGLICCWNVQTQREEDNMVTPLIGHTNRITCLILIETGFLISASNDCTVRQWDYETSECISIMKYADPITVCKYSSQMNILFTGAWDKMVRCYDME